MRNRAGLFMRALNEGWKAPKASEPPKRQRAQLAIPEPLLSEEQRAEVAQMEARLETAKTRWILADADQRSTWLERMDTVSRKLAPMNGSEPRRGFLLCLAAILESAREMKSTQPGKQNAWDWRSDASWTPAGRAMQASEEPDQGCLTK